MMKFEKPESYPVPEEAYNYQELAIDVGTRVLAARVKAGLKQTELAKLIGTTQPVIARLECGRVLPSFQFLLRIADALKTGIVAPYFSSAPRRKMPITYTLTSSAGNNLLIL